MTVNLAFSLCPNDTFCYAAWMTGKIQSEYTPAATLLDIEELNRRALTAHFPITKMSAFCYAKLQHLYDLLPVGAAIGMNVGPTVVARSKDISLTEMTRIAHPGEHTTAYALLKLAFPQLQTAIPMRYEKILQAVASGAVDAGVLIHESRFTFPQIGLVELCDLGSLYGERYKAPVPLGVLCATKDMPATIRNSCVRTLRQSIEYAYLHTDEVMPYVQHHAQELDHHAILKHIALYVTEDTHSLSQEAFHAIKLFSQATKQL